MKVSLIALAAVLVAFMPGSTVTFSDVRASQNSESSILVQWSTSEEDGVKDFAVEKASQLDNNFYQIGTVNAAGAGSSYQYVDNGIYKTTSSEVFKYRVVAIGNDGSTIASSNVAPVAFDQQSTFTGVAKRTWGSIKAMFR
ncbi:MAG: hypothetical protein WAO19_13905 [Candidatus Kryptoniota bacterium]